MKLYGHSKPESSEERWQPLPEHLENVAARARAYALSFRAGDLAEAAGLLHDQGKASLEYQERLRGAAYRVDHSTAGAQWADKNLGPMGRLIAACVAGHHAGLLDGKSSDDSCLAHRLIKKDLPKLIAVPASPDPGKAQGKLPIQQDGPRIAFQLAFFTRMLFSCLVDAVFLDTERFMDPQKASWRNGFPNLAELHRRFLPKLDAKLAAAVPTAINLKRKEILETCFDRAEDTPGLFSLTVPTGGGKTLSSLAFALKHALRHDFTRVIYDIPYTSIIEQNAEVFREFLGEDAVLEHHSAFVSARLEKKDGSEYDEDMRRFELAAENWDAPLIITTAVQFFESLFACRTSRCRKLHNIARSVVILDEAQMLPVPFLLPCLEVLRELALNYETTVVLCTATQPSLTNNN